MQQFIPLNKTILVQKVTDESISSFVPEEMKDSLRPFSVVKLLGAAVDCEKIKDFQLKVGTELVVQTNGIEKVEFGTQTFLIVQEKFIVGYLRLE